MSATARHLPQDLAVIAPENLAQLSELARWGKGMIFSLAYAPDGSQVAVVTSQGVYFYSTGTYELVRLVPIEGILEPFVISPSLRYLAMGDLKGFVTIWIYQTGQLISPCRLKTTPSMQWLSNPMKANCTPQIIY